MKKNNFFLIVLGIVLFFVLVFSFFVPQKREGAKSKEEDFLKESSFPLFSFPLVEEKEKHLFLKTLTDIKQDFVLEKKTFIEVNLGERKIRLYQEGELVGEKNINAFGNPFSWTGTPIGIYQVLDKNRVAFSVSVGVNMPYALHYEARHYIHGEPYYPGGYPIVSSSTNGCIRLKNKEAKEVFDFSQKGMLVLVINEKETFYSYQAQGKPIPKISASHFLVADLDSGFVFLEKNKDKQHSIASLTKLMTAIIVAENVDLNRKIEIKEEMLNAYGSTIGLEDGVWIKAIDLFYPLLIESSNDSAEILSAFLGREQTIEKMNEKAKKILMENTVFVDPSGYDPGNLSTVQDLFYLSRYLLKVHPLVFKITKGEKILRFRSQDYPIEKLWNKNIFIYDPNFIGGKTGYIKESGQNAIFLFKFLNPEKEERNIVFIFLGSQNLRSDTQRIYKWLKENYNLSELFHIS